MIKKKILLLSKIVPIFARYEFENLFENLYGPQLKFIGSQGLVRISLKFERNNKKSMARTFFWDFQNSYRILEISQKIRQFWRFLGQRGPQKSPKNWRAKFLLKNFELRSKFFTEIYDKIPKTVGFPTLSERATVNFWSFFGVAKTSDFIGLQSSFWLKPKIQQFLSFFGFAKIRDFLGLRWRLRPKIQPNLGFFSPKIEQNRRFCKF